MPLTLIHTLTHTHSHTRASSHARSLLLSHHTTSTLTPPTPTPHLWTLSPPPVAHPGALAVVQHPLRPLPRPSPGQRLGARAPRLPPPPPRAQFAASRPHPLRPAQLPAPGAHGAHGLDPALPPHPLPPGPPSSPCIPPTPRPSRGPQLWALLNWGPQLLLHPSEADHPSATRHPSSPRPSHTAEGGHNTHVWPVGRRRVSRWGVRSVVSHGPPAHPGCACSAGGERPPCPPTCPGRQTAHARGLSSRHRPAARAAARNLGPTFQRFLKIPRKKMAQSGEF